MSDIEPVPTYQITGYRALYDPELDFSKLASEVKQGYAARGFRLVDKEDLIGVPFICISATYREGFLSQDKSIKGDYISLECVVGDREAFALPQVRSQLPENLAVYPNEPVVINDGGTGVRRTLTKLFCDTGIIDVGGNIENDGDFIYDRPYSLWKTGMELATSGIHADIDGEPFRYFAIRGLRRSDYESPYGPPGQLATTWYFA